MPSPAKSQKKGGRRIVRTPSQLESTIKRQKLPPLQLEDLSDEVILNILSFLELPDLNRFSQVSKRLRILYRSCKNLCIKRCRLTGATYLQDWIENLELYQCDFTYGVLEALMSSSHSLKKFSLTNYTMYNLFHHNLHTFYSRNGQTLQTLNLAFTSILDEKHMDNIVKNCNVLKEIDFSNCRLSSESLNIFVCGITVNIEKVSLASSSSVTDASIRNLVSRCNKIKSLNLALNSITNNSLTSVKENLENTLEELEIGECSRIILHKAKLLKMRSMPKLKVLNYFKPLESNYEDLKKHLPQLTNNNPRDKWKGWHNRLHIIP